MLATTEGIVLHFIKYGDASVIATIYTRDFGRQSFILSAARTKKSKNKAALLQSLFLVDLVCYQKQTRDVQRIKELKLNQSYQNIPFDVVKTTLAIFIAEILYKTINEEESYPELYDFIKNNLLYFDLMENGIANFHLYFLYRLTEYLGILPDMENVSYENWFDLRKGAIVSFEPPHPMFIHKEATTYLLQLSTIKIQDLDKLKIPKVLREYLLSKLIDYYQIHFEKLGEIKSLKVLKEVFN